jgi:hypothetical protein
MGRARSGRPALKAAEKLPSFLSLEKLPASLSRRKIVILFYTDIALTASLEERKKAAAAICQKNVASRLHPLEYAHFPVGTHVAFQSGRQRGASELCTVNGVSLAIPKPCEATHGKVRTTAAVWLCSR